MTVLLALFALAAPPEKLTFEQHIRPIFKAYCLECHGAEAKPKGKLDLRLRRFLLAGGRSGPAFIAGKGEASLIVERMKAGDMPPTGGKVPPGQIALVQRWIDAGAQTIRDEPTSIPPGIGISVDERAYWFYQPLKRPPVPAFNSDRVRNPIDSFILARLRARSLPFNPDADRRTLLRRASLVVIGLPPTTEEMAVFLADARPGAYERAVDRLLASPAYGEKWARHWLDAAGYADSHGDGTRDTPRPHAWRYRDWVVRAINAGKPFDRFLVEQLAGDELVPRPWTDLKPEQADLLTATGFLRTAPDSTASGGGAAEAEQNVADTLKIVSSSLLGLSVGCAQCHDHRYDPIPQEDYFRLRAVFEPALNPAAWRRPSQRRASLYTTAERKQAASIEAEVRRLRADYSARMAKEVAKAFDKELAKRPQSEQASLRAAFAAPAAKRTPAQKKLVANNPSLKITPGVLYQYDKIAADGLKKRKARIDARLASRPVERFVSLLDEAPGKIPVTRIFHRGDYRQPTRAVMPGGLTVAAPEGKRLEIETRKGSSTGRRLRWAQYLTSGTHPLTGRVQANRAWLHLMGRGIVDTPGDFGILGQRPSHPELLDWLAVELAESGWDMKRLHRLILTSTAFRQSSRRTPSQDAVDGANTLYGRYSLRRLEAEAVRDRILMTAGRLDRTAGGSPVPVTEDATGQANAPEAQPRRSLYLQARRTRPVAFLGAFDGPAGELSCDKRASSVGAPQALMLMNSDFVVQQSAHFARRLLASPDRISLAWELAYQRTPSPREASLAASFLAKQKRLGELASLTNLCQQLFASSEFLYVE